MGVSELAFSKKDKSLQTAVSIINCSGYICEVQVTRNEKLYIFDEEGKKSLAETGERLKY